MTQENPAVENLNQQHPHLPAVLVLDTSATIRPYEHEMAEGVQEMLKTLSADDITRWYVDLGIVGFNKTPYVIQEIKNINSAGTIRKAPECHGRTHIGEAVLQAMDMLDAYKKELKANGIRSAVPLIILVTDGNPLYSAGMEQKGKEALNTAIQKIQERTSQKKLRMIVIGLGEICNQNMLKQLSGGENTSPNNGGGACLMLDNPADMKTLFSLISEAISITSSGVNISDVKETINKDENQTFKTEKSPPKPEESALKTEEPLSEDWTKALAPETEKPLSEDWTKAPAPETEEPLSEDWTKAPAPETEEPIPEDWTEKPVPKIWIEKAIPETEKPIPEIWTEEAVPDTEEPIPEDWGDTALPKTEKITDLSELLKKISNRFKKSDSDK